MSLILKNLGRKVNHSWIIHKLNLKVDKGECLALLGPSGCGKSSTLRLIAGLDKPDEGSILIGGEDVTNISPVKRKVGMVFQSYALFPHLSVAANLSLGLKVRGVSEVEQKKRVFAILELMKLEKFAIRLPAQLSGGQRQRVALARALLRDPLIYLLDEPMSNLDAQLREDLRPEIRTLILGGNKPVIYVTHDQHEAMAMANKIAILNEGVLEQVGTPKELYENPSSLFVAKFIGRPQINIIEERKEELKCIRPEDIKFKSNGLRAKLEYKEWLGSEQLILFKTSKGSIKMLCKGSDEIPEDAYIGWAQDKEHYFNKKTGYRVNKLLKY